LKIAIDQSDTDAGFGADIVHARLVKTPFGKKLPPRFQDLRFFGRAATRFEAKHGRNNEWNVHFIVNGPLFLRPQPAAQRAAHSPS